VKHVYILAGIVGVAGLLFAIVWRSRVPEADSWKQAGPRPSPAGGAVAVPSRFPDARPVPLDLSRHFNASLDASWHTPGTANHLGSFPKGEQTFGEIPFRVAGIVQLGARIDKPWASQYPERVSGIPVGTRCRAIHALHGTGMSEKDGVTLGRFVVRYREGPAAEIPIVYGQHVRDWWYNPQTPEAAESAVAWTGTNEASAKAGMVLRIYRTSWVNPHPDLEVASLDFASSMAGSAPFLLALTVSAMGE
jgi:hypothetical protein